jgi:hypothetical protein
MSDTPETDAQAYDVGGYQHEYGSIVLSTFARQLERELASVKEQRDRLAEALRIVMADYRLDGRVSAEADMLANEALAAVKGENNE